MKRKAQFSQPSTGTTPNSKKTRSSSAASPIADAKEDIDAVIEAHSSRLQSTGTADTEGKDSVIGSNGDEEDMDGRDLGDEIMEDVPEVTTPAKLRMDTPKDISTPSRGELNGATPRKLLGKTLFATPLKDHGTANTNDTPRLERHADRSARRKSTRSLIERTVLGNTSDNEDEDEDVAQHIYGSDDDDEDVGQGAMIVDEDPTLLVPNTPSKKSKAKGGKGRKRSPTPPQDLPPHELYFSQNRSGRSKTSNNTLSSLKLLDHEEYFKLTREHQDPYADDLAFRQELLAESFNQWDFELSQDFNICLYGWGSKRSLLMEFAKRIYRAQKDHANNTIVVINGYIHNLTVKDVLNTVASAIAERGTKLGAQPAEMLQNLIALFKSDPSKHVTVIIHSIDGAGLRRPTTQAILSRLSSLPQIHMVTSADHPSFPLLWDSSIRSTFNFIFHDCTTFQPYTSELDVVDEVHELLGRQSRRVGGKEGVIFVLKSLPDNAQKLFKVLVAEQLAGMDENLCATFGKDGDDDNNEPRLDQLRRTEPGVEWRVLYQKVVEEFICSNEMNFRTLLKEFYDHQMIQSRKDGLGTEIISAPFRKEELENILEDIGS